MSDSVLTLNGLFAADSVDSCVSSIPEDFEIVETSHTNLDKFNRYFFVLLNANEMVFLSV